MCVEKLYTAINSLVTLPAHPSSVAAAERNVQCVFIFLAVHADETLAIENVHDRFKWTVRFRYIPCAVRHFLSLIFLLSSSSISSSAFSVLLSVSIIF